MNILIVEDEEELALAVKNYLIQQNYHCEIAGSQEAAMDSCLERSYELVILDLNLPDGSGLEFLDWLIKDNSEAAVLIVSARNSTDDRIKGLDLGADDYLTKPFHMGELNSRVNALLRRKFKADGEKITFEELALDVQAKTASVNERQLDLTTREFDLLRFFMINKNRVVTKKSVASHLWKGTMNLDDNYELIYTYIKTLRKKIVSAGGKDYLKSVYGVGYKFGDV